MKRLTTMIILVLGMTFINSCKKEEVAPDTSCSKVDLVIAPMNLGVNHIEIYVPPGQLPYMPEWSKWVNDISVSQPRSFDNRDAQENYCGDAITVKTTVTDAGTGRAISSYNTVISWEPGDTLWVTPTRTYIK